MTKTYSDFFDFFDQIFSEAFIANKPLDLFGTQAPRINKLVSSSQFPPANIFCNTKTKDLIIQVALAGYSEDDINLTFEGDYLKLEVDKGEAPQVAAEEITEYVIQRGIKLPNHVEACWKIDPRYYSRDNVTVDFKDGLLTIKIFPKEDMKPINKTLFGKLGARPKQEAIEE